MESGLNLLQVNNWYVTLLSLLLFIFVLLFKV